MKTDNLKNRLGELFSSPVEGQSAAASPAEPKAAPAAPAPSAAAAPPAGAAPPAAAALRAEGTHAPSAAEDVYRTLVESFPHSIFRKDRASRFTFANRQFCASLGKPLEDVLGKTDFDFYPADLAEKYVQDDRQVMESGQGYETVEGHQAPGEERKYVQVVKTPVFDEHGACVGLQCMFWDVSDSMRARVGRQRAESFLDSIVENLPSMVFVKDAQDLRFVLWNKAGEDIVGYRREDLLGKNDYDFFPAEEADFFTSKDRAVLDSGQLLDIAEEPIDTAHGRRWLHTRKTPIVDGEGRPQYLLGISEDITERKRDEERILRQNRTLAALNRASQGFSHLAQPAEIVDLLYEVMGEVLDNRNLYVALYDEASQTVDFPLYTVGGERRAVAGRPVGDGLTEYVLRTQAPLLLPCDVSAELARRGVQMIGEPACSLLSAPIVAGGKSLGVITVQDYANENVFDEAHLEVLTTVASQAATALENARLYAAVQAELDKRGQLLDDLERRAVQLRTAAEVSRAATSILDPAELLSRAVDLIRERFELYYVGLFLVDAGRTFAELRAGTGDAGRQMLERGHRLAVDERSMIGWCVLHRQARIALDVGDEAVRFNNPLLPDTRSELALPLISRGEVIGAMTVQSRDVAAFTEADVAVLQTMADQVANAISNARLYDASQRRAVEQAALYDLSRALSAQLSVEQVLNQVHRGVSQLLDTTNFYIALYDAGRHEVSFVINATESQVDRAIEVAPADSGLTGYIIRSRAPLLIQEDVGGWVDRMGLTRVGELAESWLGVPLLVGDRVLGVMAIQSYVHARLYNEHDRDLLMAIASQAAIALQNAQLFEQSRQQVEELAILNRISQNLSHQTNLQALASVLVDELRSAAGVPDAYLALYDRESNMIRILAMVEGNQRVQVEPFLAGTGLTSWIIEHRQPLLLNRDAVQRAQELGAQLVGEPAQSYLGVPVLVGPDAVGVIAVQDREREGLFGEREQRLLTTIAPGVGVAVQNARLFEEVRQRAAEMAMLNSIGQALTSQLDPESMLTAVGDKVCLVFNVDDGYIALVDPDSNELEFAYWQEDGQALQVPPRPLAGGLPATVIESRRPLLVNTTADDAAAVGSVPAGSRDVMRSWLGVPILVGPQAIGLINVRHRDANRFTKDDADLLGTIAASVGTMIQRARLLEQTQAARQQAEARVVELSVLNEIARAVGGLLDAEQLVMKLYEQIRRVAKVDAFYIVLYDAETGLLTYPLCYDEGRWYGRQVSPLETSHRVHRAITTGEAFIERAAPEELAAPLSPDQVIGSTRMTAEMLFAPMRIGDRITGVLSVQSYAYDAYDPDDLALLNTIAGQAAVALENAHLYEQTQAALTESRTLVEVSARLNSATSLDGILAAGAAPSVAVGATGTELWSLEMDAAGEPVALQLVAGWAHGGTPATPIGARFDLAEFPFSPAWLGNPGQPVLVDNVELLPHLDEAARALFDRIGARALALMPLLYAGRWLGLLAAYWSLPHEFAPNDARLYKSIGDQMAVALENRRLFEQTQAALAQTRRLAQREHLINEISGKIRAAVSIDEVLRIATEELRQATGSTHAAARLHEPAAVHAENLT